LNVSTPQAALRDRKSIALKQSLIIYPRESVMLNDYEGRCGRFEHRH